MNLHPRTWSLFGLALAGLSIVPVALAQDQAETAETSAAEKKTSDVIPAAEKKLTPEQIKAEETRKKLLKYDSELKLRLENTVWNDLGIRAGSPGQVWLLRPAKQVGNRVEQAWFLNDENGLPRVGSWSVKDGEILLTAMNGTLVGRGKYNDDEILGKFIDADHHREYGQFRLKEETKRNYRVLPLRDNQPPKRRR